MRSADSPLRVAAEAIKAMIQPISRIARAPRMLGRYTPSEVSSDCCHVTGCIPTCLLAGAWPMAGRD